MASVQNIYPYQTDKGTRWRYDFRASGKRYAKRGFRSELEAIWPGPDHSIRH